MLVLSRKPGERLQIGQDITVTVLEVHGHTLRIGIEAPGHVRILRGELKCWNEPAKAVARHEPAAPAVAV